MRRIIAYIYHYKIEEDVLYKCNNTGFCRVEQNNHKNIVTLSLKDGCGVEGKASIYILKEVADSVFVNNSYQKIKLDKQYTACAGVLNVKLSVENSDGIYVECGGRIYAALWKGNYDRIRIVQSQMAKEQKVQEEKKQEDKEQEGKEQEERKKIKGKQQIEEKQQIGERQQEKNMTRQETEKNINVTKKYEDYTRIYNRLGKIRVILNGIEYPAVKLKPYEIMFLPRSCWRMANNPFLIESYYRYGHILFMQYEGSYVLVVPWNKERGIEMQAKRFGFTKYLTGYEYGKTRDERLYWIKYL